MIESNLFVLVINLNPLRRAQYEMRDRLDRHAERLRLFATRNNNLDDEIGDVT
jgi:hypothetical protein